MIGTKRLHAVHHAPEVDADHPRQSSRVWSRNRLKVETPALLHSTSTRPKRSSVVAASRSTAAASDDVDGDRLAPRRPSARIPPATASASAAVEVGDHDRRALGGERLGQRAADAAGARRSPPPPGPAPITPSMRRHVRLRRVVGLPSQPPSSRISSPVRYDDASLARYSAVPTISSADAMRPERDARGHLRLQLLRRDRRVQAVGVERAAHDRVDADAARPELLGGRLRRARSSPAFAAAYTTVNDDGCSDAFELTLMIDPPAGMCSAASAVSRSGPLRLTAIVLSNRSGVTSSSDGGTGAMPALLTSTSMRPNSATVASIERRALVPVADVAAHRRARAGRARAPRRPPLRTARACGSRPRRRRPPRRTRAPSPARDPCSRR